MAFMKPKQTLNILCWNSQPQTVTTPWTILESHIHHLWNLNIKDISSLNESIPHSHDILIVHAEFVPKKSFSNWIKAIQKKDIIISNQEIPTLILADLSFQDQEDILQEALDSSWVFDILSHHEMNSLPIRIANLTKIKQKNKTIADLNQKLDSLENKLKIANIKLAKSIKTI